MKTKLASREQEREVLAWIIRKFPEGRMSADDAQYLIEHVEELPDMILTMVARRIIVTPTQLRAVVSDWQKLLTACQQHWVNPDFTEKRWPLEQVVSDEAEWEVAEHFFDDNATNEEKLRRLAEMAEKGEIRLCGVRRAMEYVATHLDVQLDYPLIVPVPARRSDGVLCLPIFLRHWNVNRPRNLRLFFVSRRFNPFCAWLVLRKRS